MALENSRHLRDADRHGTPPAVSACGDGAGGDVRPGDWCASPVYFADIDEAPATCILRSRLALLHRYAACLVALSEGAPVRDSLAGLELLRRHVRTLLDGLGTVASANVARELAALEAALDATGARATEARSVILASQSLVFAVLDGCGALAPEILQAIAEDGTPTRRRSAGLGQRRTDQQAVAGYLDHLAGLRTAFAAAAGVAVRPRPSGTCRPHPHANGPDLTALLGQFGRALRIASTRLDSATEQQELASLTAALATIHRQIALLEQHGDLAAIVAVASVAAALQDTLGTAALHPSGEACSFLGQTEHCLDRLGLLHRELRAAPMPMPGDAPPPGQATARAVSSSLRFPDIAGEYAAMFAACVIRPRRAGLVRQTLDLLRHHRVRYAEAARHFAGVPWYFVGIVHAMEAAFDCTGPVPSDWELTAQAALWSMLRDSEGDFSLPRVLYVFEQFDGFGYRRSGRASPYLWAFSTYCEHGMQNQSDRFEPCPVGRQTGAAVLLKALNQAGELIA